MIPVKGIVLFIFWFHNLNSMVPVKGIVLFNLVYIFIYVRRKVRIGTIPELSCAKQEFSLCGSIPELYRYNSRIAQGILVVYRTGESVCEKRDSLGQSGNRLFH